MLDFQLSNLLPPSTPFAAIGATVSVPADPKAFASLAISVSNVIINNGQAVDPGGTPGGPTIVLSPSSGTYPDGFVSDLAAIAPGLADPRSDVSLNGTAIALNVPLSLRASDVAASSLET